MSMCRIFSCVVGRGCLLWPVRSPGRTLLTFALLHSVLQGHICLLLQMATHSSTFAWKIPWMEEPGRLHSMGSLRVGYDWATSLSLSCIGEGNGNPRQCSCLENPRDGGALWTAVYGVAQSRTRLKWRSSSSRKQCLLETLWGRHQGMEGKWTRTPCSLWWTCRYLQTVYMSCFGVYISGHLFIHLLYFACQKKICFAYTFNEEKTR